MNKFLSKLGQSMYGLKRKGLATFVISSLIAVGALAGDVRYIYSFKSKAAHSYFMDDEPGSMIWVYGMKNPGAVGYFQKGEDGNITYIYRYGTESPLYFTESHKGPIHIYSVGSPGVWGYINK